MLITNRFIPLFFTCIFSLLLSSGCKTGKGLAKPVALKDRDTQFLLKKLSQKRIKADWFDGKAKVHLISEKENRRFISTIRMRKDSVIWMNFKKNSIEAARLLITKDSMFVINRLDNEYAKVSFADLQKDFWPFEQTDNLNVLQQVQDLLLGNPIFFNVKSITSKTKGETYQLTGSSKEFTSRYSMDGMKYLLVGLSFLSVETSNSLDATYGDFVSINKNNIPHFRIFDIRNPENGLVRLEFKFSKIEVDQPVKMPFSIPTRYTQINW